MIVPEGAIEDLARDMIARFAAGAADRAMLWSNAFFVLGFSDRSLTWLKVAEAITLIANQTSERGRRSDIH